MVVTVTQTEKILTGDYKFSQLGFSLLITRWKRIYNGDTSQSTLEDCVEEINTFLRKYAIIMAEDYAAISQL